MEVKDVGIEELHKKMYNLDFCDDNLLTLNQVMNQNCDASVSWEDKKYLNLMNKTRMVWLSIALQKWWHNTAKKQMSSAKKIEAFEKHYKEFMNTLLISNSFEIWPSSAQDDFKACMLLNVMLIKKNILQSSMPIAFTVTSFLTLDSSSFGY